MKLRLGPLPNTQAVRVTVMLPVELKATLDLYARVHGEAWGEPVEGTALIPHILKAFIDGDPTFRKYRAAGSER